MARGEPLDDADRAPWLKAVAARMKSGQGSVVMGCSALKRVYRDTIRDGAGSPVMFLHLAGSRDLIAGRMSAREGHFMRRALLDRQFAALEPPGADGLSRTVDIDRSEAAIIAWIAAQIGAAS